MKCECVRMALGVEMEMAVVEGMTIGGGGDGRAVEAVAKKRKKEEEKRQDNVLRWLPPVYVEEEGTEGDVEEEGTENHTFH